MKILVVSDTHFDTQELQRLLEKYANEVQLVCHLGNDAMDLLKFQHRYPNLSMAAVKGNGDFGMNIQNEIVLALNPTSNKDVEKRILLTHGHNLGVMRDSDRLAYYAREKKVDACFYGHTHIPEMRECGGVFIMNPGSPSCPRGGSKASYGIVEISDTGEITGKLFPIA